MCLDVIEEGTGVRVCPRHRIHGACLDAWMKTDKAATQRPCPQCRQPTGVVALTHMAQAVAPVEIMEELRVLGQLDLAVRSTQSFSVETTVWVCAWSHPKHAHNADRMAKAGTWSLHGTSPGGIGIWDAARPPLPIRSFSGFTNLEIMLADLDPVLRLPASGHHLLLPIQCSKDWLCQMSSEMMRHPVPWRLWMDHENTLWWALTLTHWVDQPRLEEEGLLWWRMYDTIHRCRSPPKGWAVGIPSKLRDHVDLPPASGALHLVDPREHWCQMITMDISRKDAALQSSDMVDVSKYLATAYGGRQEKK